MHDNSSAEVPVNVFVNPPVIVSDSGNQVSILGHPFIKTHCGKTPSFSPKNQFEILAFSEDNFIGLVFYDRFFRTENGVLPQCVLSHLLW